MSDDSPTNPGFETKPAGKVAQALVVGGSAEPDGELASSPWRLAAIAGGMLALGLLAGWSWVVIIVALTVMIFLHELGHFLTAKWAGMKVTEFCILGVGPKLWSTRRGETEIMIRAIPIAAYVRIVGMNNLDECDPADEPRAFRQQSFPKRVLVMSGGSLMHFVQAFVLLVVVFGFVGVPGDSVLAQQVGGPAPRWGIVEPIEGFGAEKAGIRAGDEIVSIDGRPVDEPEDIGPLVDRHIGDTIPMVVLRDGRERTLPVDIGANPDNPKAGFIGVRIGGLDDEPLPAVTVGPVDAAIEAADTTVDWGWQTLRGLGNLATGGLGDFARDVVGTDDGPGPGVVSGKGAPSNADDSSSSSGEARPISILGVARLGADAGTDVGQVLLLLAVVNISIGLINLLPLLPFDGGHIAIAVYERLRSRKGRRHMADVSRLLPLTYAVVLLLGLIMVSSIYLDIVDPVGLG